MDEYRIVYTNHARERMFERGIREEEIDHVLAFGLSIKKNERALPLPKEEISCHVGSRLISVVVDINHASRTKIVITAYAKEKRMKCIICDIGETKPGMTTVTLQRDGTIIVVKNVPADVCQVCGEAYTDQQVTRRLLQVANEEAQKGPREEFIQYIA